ncbi:unnamed protein product [Cochlearia groenlandica]
MDSDSTFKLVELITQAISSLASSINNESQISSVVTKMIYLFNSADPELDYKRVIDRLISLGVPEALDTKVKFKLLIIQSMDSFAVSVIDPERQFASLFRQYVNLVNEGESVPKSEFMSLNTQIVSILGSLEMDDSGLGMDHLVSLCPRIEVKFELGKLIALGEVSTYPKKEEKCNPSKWSFFCYDYFHCKGCNGDSHEGHEKAPVEFKHPYHPEHFLHLVLLSNNNVYRGCYCCGNELRDTIYACLVCDFAMNVACLEKPQVLYSDQSKWHEHKLDLFPRQTSLTCNVCGLSRSSYAFYMCPPCDFVVHSKCLSLPRVLKISRHPHRISFINSFSREDFFCGICRKKIDEDFGGFSCIKDGCSYATHSVCATQRNVWDGKDLEGVPEEIEEEVLEPFVKISDGVIQHFSHDHHHLRLNENASGDYDEDIVCEACHTPIFFGKFYTCKKCDFVLHEECANHPRKMHHPTHAHMLTLVTDKRNVIWDDHSCSVCPRILTGFFYSCKRGIALDDYKLHVECASVAEPLMHESHEHPLFLTSIPGESRECRVCKDLYSTETFNCIECDFSLCFKCATLPHKVRYKHDKHMLTLSYAKETSTTTYWCEICEGKINPSHQRFYACDEYCCVTLHVTCLLQTEFYMKQGSFYREKSMDIMRNNHMTRPKCGTCGKRCTFKVFLQGKDPRGRIACSLKCS